VTYPATTGEFSAASRQDPRNERSAVIDLDAIRHNVRRLADAASPAKVLAVVKADAYGHGLKPIAALLMQSGTDIFGVANLAEARSIRSVGKGWPILMLGSCLPGEIDLAVREDVMPTLSNFEEAEQFSQAALRHKKKVFVHVKIDTGMGRLGVPAEEGCALLEQLQSVPGLKIQGLYTHFASVEDDEAYSRRQAQRFKAFLGELDEAGIRVPLIHANNSGAVLLEKRTLFNAVRPGLLVYGVVPPMQRAMIGDLHQRLRPALSWKCRVSLVKPICKGTALSYGGTFKAPRAMRVATLTAGYGDGYLRAGSNRAQVLIAGRRCPVLGRVTMDQMLVDVSALEQVQPGDEAVLLGRQNEEEITACELAGWCQTIPWEVFTNITYRVARLYRGGQAA
jgi:alanine racemase